MCLKMERILKENFWIIKLNVNWGNIPIDFLDMREGSKTMSSTVKENNPPISILLLEHTKGDWRYVASWNGKRQTIRNSNSHIMVNSIRMVILPNKVLSKSRQAAIQEHLPEVKSMDKEPISTKITI